MRRSIRWRLQLWYAAVLQAVVAGFACLLYYQVSAARYREVDAGLEAAAQYLEAMLRRFPPHELGGPFPDQRFRPPRPPDDEPRPPPGFRPRPNRQRLLAELDLPPRGGSGPDDGRPSASYFAVWRADGSLLKASHFPPELGSIPPADVPCSQLPHFNQRGEYREALMLGAGESQILVGRSVARERDELRAFAWQLAGAGAVVLAVGLAGGWLLSARILRPVAAIAATASSLSATNLSGRIDPEAVDRELADLARVLNATFDRLEAAFERQARFTADASHELRTPLAILRRNAELALTRPRSADEYRETVLACLRAAQRMTELVEGLLILARADAGKLDLQREVVDLQDVVAETVAPLRPLVEAKALALSTRLAPTPVAGDAVRLGQVVTNLLSNAIQYNRPGGEVRVELDAGPGEVTLSVADTGCGIPEEDRPHLFERFHRVDKARARASGGNGLGLAISKSIVEAHGGTIAFTSEPGQGSTFSVHLPRATDEPPRPS
jgi:two-component system, OmpR family, sensor kinase